MREESLLHIPGRSLTGRDQPGEGELQSLKGDCSNWCAEDKPGKVLQSQFVPLHSTSQPDIQPVRWAGAGC